MILRHLFVFIFVWFYSLLKKPKKITLDLCNKCQLNCLKCWIRRDEKLIREQHGGFGYVDYETFKNFVDKNNFIEEIEISNNGEALLNPDFNKIIKYAYEHGIRLTALNGVNLNYLTDEMAENIVKYNFKDLMVSIDGTSQETYSIYRRNGNFDKVIENVKKINKYKEKYNSEYPKIIYKFIIFKHNEHEIEQAKKLAEELKMEMFFTKDFFNEPLNNYDLVKKQAKDFDKNLDFLCMYQKSKKNKKYFCFCEAVFISPVIDYNGEMFGCCALHLDGFKVNVFKEGIMKALRSPKMIYAKAMLLDPSIKERDDIPCSKCSHYYELKQHKCSLFKNIMKKGLF